MRYTHLKGDYMKSTIRIPEKIKIGYQNRSDTYTGKLAYVIYYDNKGKLRKEVSWNSWRDTKIEEDNYSNTPTSGFVLNKKAGGYSNGWNHRNTYVRVYDPRGFEFEISVPNLLFILENATSSKGKGLEGDFIYGWDGKDLVLLPCDCPDYIEISKLNDKMKANNYKGKDLVVGGTYLTSGNEEIIYMGRFILHSSYKMKKAYFFYNRTRSNWYTKGEAGGFEFIGTLGDYLIDTISDKCVEDYADIFDKMEYYEYYNPYSPEDDEYIYHTLKSFVSYIKNNESTIYNRNNDSYKYFSYCTSGKERQSKDNYGSYQASFQIDRSVIVWIETMKDTKYTGYHPNYRRTENFECELTVEEFFNNRRPQWKKEYLADGKLRGIKYYE